jgi:cytochrome c oxidase subunit II
MTGRGSIGAVLLVLAGCGGTGASTASDPAELAADVGCLACHTEADTSVAPTLHGIWGSEVELADGRTVTVDESYVRRSITDPTADVVAGYGPTMPRLPLDESEVDLLVEWVRSLE